MPESNLAGVPASSVATYTDSGHNSGNPPPAAMSSTPNTPVKVDNPMPHRLPEGENAAPLEVIGTTASDKLVIIMVGLPATGKTHIAKRICRFLSFFHDIPSQIFNVGDYRRQLCGANMPASFYDPSNEEGAAARHMACDAALADLVEYVKKDGVRVAAFDATNSTKERRQHILGVLDAAGIGAKRMFVESICDQEEVSEVTSAVPHLSWIYVPFCCVCTVAHSGLAYFPLVSLSCWKKTFARLNSALPTTVIWIRRQPWTTLNVVVAFILTITNPSMNQMVHTLRLSTVDSSLSPTFVATCHSRLFTLS
jgi:predicted kinase